MSVRKIDVSRLAVVAASVVAGLGLVQQSQAVLQSAGTVEVDLRAADLASGSSITTWNNTRGASGGSFTSTTAAAVGPVADSASTTYRAVQLNSIAGAPFRSSFFSPASLNGNSSRSVETWVRNAAIDNNEETVAAWGHRGTADQNSAFSYGSQYGAAFWADDLTFTANPVPPQTGVAPTANIWHYLVYTYDGSNKQASVYVDGGLKYQLTLANVQATPQFLIDIGGQNAADGTLDGGERASIDLASLRISSGALTAANVTNNFNEGVPLPEPASLGAVGLVGLLLLGRRMNKLAR